MLSRRALIAHRAHGDLTAPLDVPLVTFDRALLHYGQHHPQLI